jgi:hypothetical protein
MSRTVYPARHMNRLQSRIGIYNDHHNTYHTESDVISFSFGYTDPPILIRLESFAASSAADALEL